mmetsp:Transcript_41312/g.127646  ORF Transcript_41312/g.127646 Transcript_41312/m.127646 type:complete len:245 (-) Transcript_41312:298-1032(-)
MSKKHDTLMIMFIGCCALSSPVRLLLIALRSLFALSILSSASCSMRSCVSSSWPIWMAHSVMRPRPAWIRSRAASSRFFFSARLFISCAVSGSSSSRFDGAPSPSSAPPPCAARRFCAFKRCANVCRRWDCCSVFLLSAGDWSLICLASLALKYRCWFSSSSDSMTSFADATAFSRSCATRSRIFSLSARASVVCPAFAIFLFVRITSRTAASASASMAFTSAFSVRISALMSRDMTAISVDVL